MVARRRMPKLPSLLKRKIYKTGQTRGADDDVIYQNRVLRSSTVLIPYSLREDAWRPPPGEDEFENGYTVLISPRIYFETPDVGSRLAERGLQIGGNALVFYRQRSEWEEYNPDDLGWSPASERSAPLGGEYVARIAATTAFDGGDRINRGYTTTRNKGAGIRLYEYASGQTIDKCRSQLEALYWLCRDAQEVVVKHGMNREAVEARRGQCLEACRENGLLDRGRLREGRVINDAGVTVCPLCLKELSGAGFLSRLEQAEGRHVHDLTVTKVNLFHVSELRYGEYNHRPYNLGWGHHHCNVVVRDAGIADTLEWMDEVLARNGEAGHFSAREKSAS